MVMTSTEFARRLKLKPFRTYLKQNIIYLHKHIAPHGSSQRLGDILGISNLPKNYAYCQALLDVFTEGSQLYLTPEDLLLKPVLFKSKCMEAFVLHKLEYDLHAYVLPWRHDVKRNLAYLHENMVYGAQAELELHITRINLWYWLQEDRNSMPSKIDAQILLDFVAHQYQKPLCVDDLLLPPDEFMAKCVFVESFKVCYRAEPWQDYAKQNMRYLFDHFSARGAQTHLAQKLDVHAPTINNWLSLDYSYRMPDFDQATALIAEFTQGYSLALTPDDLMHRN